MFLTSNSRVLTNGTLTDNKLTECSSLYKFIMQLFINLFGEHKVYNIDQDLTVFQLKKL